jgi:translation initiation factor 2-alpha kinase 1
MSQSTQEPLHDTLNQFKRDHAHPLHSSSQDEPFSDESDKETTEFSSDHNAGFSSANDIDISFGLAAEPKANGLRAAGDNESQGRLLLVSLLENFCDLYDRRPERNRRLYLALCRRLSSMGILQSSDFVDESVNVRNAYRSIFKDLVIEAIGSIQREEDPHAKMIEGTPASSQSSALTSSLATRGSSSKSSSQENLIDLFVPVLSRYAEDFVEEHLLGRGGFGQVVVARNKLDGKRYAIKKISFSSVKSLRYERIQREVKCLAELDHPNIVRYHSAWLEEYRSDRSVSNSGSEDSSEGYEDASEDDEDEDDDSKDEEDPMKVITGGLVTGTHKPKRQRAKTCTIFIQMELCKFTLGDWIKERNRLISETKPSLLQTASPPASSSEGTPSQHLPSQSSQLRLPSTRSRARSLSSLKTEQLVDVTKGHDSFGINANENRRIFKQIVKGLVHIHDRGLIHRDLKPQNILFQASDTFVPKIGDFGLVSDVAMMMRESEEHFKALFPGLHDHHHHHGRNHHGHHDHHIRLRRTSSTSSSNMTGGLGTSTYASPEQLKGEEYDEKTDIYSLGILLFELFNPFQTQMERAHVLRDLKEQQKFPAAFVRRYPREAAFIWSCIAPEPALRPSAREIVESEVLDDPEAEDLVTLITAENDTLKTMLEWTERDVHHLHAINQLQQMEIDFLNDRLCQYERAMGLGTSVDPDNPSSSEGDES